MPLLYAPGERVFYGVKDSQLLGCLCPQEADMKSADFSSCGTPSPSRRP